MTTAYHSKLISDLYRAKDAEEAHSILQDINEITNVCFLYPIYDSYKKYNDHYWSYAFLDSISKIDSKEAHEIIKEIAKSKNTGSNDFISCLDDLIKVSDFDEEVVERAKIIFTNYYVQSEKYIMLYNLLDYLKKANALAEFSEILKDIFFNNSFDKEDRKVALYFFLIIDSKTNYQYFIDNFDTIKNKDSEIILTREILGWKGGKVDILIEKIKKEGSSASKLLIEKKNKNEEEILTKKETKDSEQFSNGKQVANISTLRQKINEKSLSLFDHKIFPDDETLISQIETAKDKNSMVICCSNLRDIMQNIESSAKNHNMTFEEASKLIPGIDSQSINKSVNSLQLYLFSKKITVSNDLFGIRNLLRIVSLLGAHQEDENLIPTLKKEKLIDLYISEQWQLLHREILERYVKSLELFSSSLVLNLKD